MSNREPSEAAALASYGARSARKQHARELFRALPQRYDLLSAAFSFGQDPRWRSALVDAIAPRDGECVLDVATGTGMVAAELLSRSGCAVVGRGRFGATASRAALVVGTPTATSTANAPSTAPAASRRVLRLACDSARVTGASGGGIHTHLATRPR